MLLELTADLDVARRRALFDFVLLLFGDTGHQTPNLKAKLPGLAVAMVFHGEHAETDLGDVKVVPTALSIAFVEAPTARTLAHSGASLWATLVAFKIIRCRSTEPMYAGEPHVLEQRCHRCLRKAALRVRAFDLVTDFAIKETVQIVGHRW